MEHFSLEVLLDVIPDLCMSKLYGFTSFSDYGWSDKLLHLSYENERDKKCQRLQSLCELHFAL
jgi:hypothetical protein